jgi:hypothetical protein
VHPPLNTRLQIVRLKNSFFKDFKNLISVFFSSNDTSTTAAVLSAVTTLEPARPSPFTVGHLYYARECAATSRIRSISAALPELPRRHSHTNQTQVRMSHMGHMWIHMRDRSVRALRLARL